MFYRRDGFSHFLPMARFFSHRTYLLRIFFNFRRRILNFLRFCFSQYVSESDLTFPFFFVFLHLSESYLVLALFYVFFIFLGVRSHSITNEMLHKYVDMKEGNLNRELRYRNGYGFSETGTRILCLSMVVPNKKPRKQINLWHRVQGAQKTVKRKSRDTKHVKGKQIIWMANNGALNYTTSLSLADSSRPISGQWIQLANN